MPASRMIQIPGPFTFFRTYDVPPLDVEIPLVAYTRPTRWIIQAAFSGLVGMMFWAVALAVAMAVHNGANPGVLIGATVVCFAFASAVYWVSMSFRCVRKAVSTAPVLRIDDEGFHDYRADVLVPWNTVQSMTTEHSRHGMVGIAFTLKRPITYRRSRLPIWKYGQWRRPENEFPTFTTRLDVSQYVIMHAAAHFIREHGGSAEMTRWE